MMAGSEDPLSADAGIAMEVSDSDVDGDHESLAFVVLFEFLYESDGERLVYTERASRIPVWWHGTSACLKLTTIGFFLCAVLMVLATLTWSGTLPLLNLSSDADHGHDSADDRPFIAGHKDLGGIVLAFELFVFLLLLSIRLAGLSTYDQVIMLTNYRVVKVGFSQGLLWCAAPRIKVTSLPFGLVDPDEAEVSGGLVKLSNKHARGSYHDRHHLQLVTRNPTRLLSHIRAALQHHEQYVMKNHVAAGSGAPASPPPSVEVLHSSKYRYERMQTPSPSLPSSPASTVGDTGRRARPLLPLEFFMQLARGEKVRWSSFTRWGDVLLRVIAKSLVAGVCLTCPLLFLAPLLADIIALAIIVSLFMLFYCWRLARAGVGSVAYALTDAGMAVLHKDSSQSVALDVTELYPLEVERDGRPGCWSEGKILQPLSSAPEAPHVPYMDVAERVLLRMYRSTFLTAPTPVVRPVPRRTGAQQAAEADSLLLNGDHAASL